MTADDRLKQALGLGADAPPTTDHGFAARIAERIEQRRFRERILVLGLWAGVAAVLAWVLARSIAASGLEISTSLQPAIPVLVLVGSAWLLGRTDMGRLFVRVRRSLWPV